MYIGTKATWCSIAPTCDEWECLFSQEHKEPLVSLGTDNILYTSFLGY